MAGSEMSLGSEHVQKLLQCAVCLERFKQPKLLPCQHTFCLSPCLEGLVDRRTHSLRCPECRADHFVPRNGLASFPNNLTIIGFLELSGASARAIDSYGRHESGSSRPLLETIQPQRTASPQYFSQDSSGSPEVIGCYVCRDNSRITRCCHCDRLLCEDCRRSHMEQVRTDLTRMISHIRRGLPHMTDQISSTSRKSNQLQNNCECIKIEITEAVDKHTRELKSRERTLHEDVDTFLSGEIRNLRGYQENTEVEMASLTSFCDTVESVLSMTRPLPDGDMVELKRQGQEHLETVQCYEDGTTRPPAVKQIQASFESPFISSLISNFGEFVITSRAVPITQIQPPDEEMHMTAEPLPSGRQLHPPNSPSSRNDDGPGAREPSQSPAGPRRRQSPPRLARASQVHFNEEEEELENSQWGALTQSSRPNRRSREERRSDSRILNTAEGRGQTLAQQMRDRTRHLSLDAIPAGDEYSDDDTSERDASPSFGLAIPRSRPDERSDLAPVVALSSSFPLTRPNTLLSRYSNSAQADAIEPVASTLAHSSNPSPSIYVNTPRNRYNQKGTAVLRFGQRGSGTAEFTWPRGVAASPLDDNIYISDSSNHRVQVFDSTGRLHKTFGRYGQGEGEFDCLAGIAINGLGQVIIADRYNHRVQIFDRNGNFQNAFGFEGSGEGQLNYPWGVACDNMGFIYVCDKENHRVQVFQSNGSFVRMFGQFGNRTGQFENPHYIAVSPDNTVYVSDSSNHRIQVFSMYGDFLFSFGTCGSLRGQMKFPRGLAIDSQGFVVVADSGNNRIQIFRADGRFYTMFGSWGCGSGQFKGLEGLTILANGNVVVSDRENHRVQIF